MRIYGRISPEDFWESFDHKKTASKKARRFLFITTTITIMKLRYFLAKYIFQISNTTPIKKPIWPSMAPIANIQLAMIRLLFSSPKELASMYGNALARTIIKLSAIILIPRGELLRITARIGFHMLLTTSSHLGSHNPCKDHLHPIAALIWYWQRLRHFHRAGQFCRPQFVVPARNLHPTSQPLIPRG